VIGQRKIPANLQDRQFRSMTAYSKKRKKADNPASHS
jgi:hypothetical protein